MAFTLGSRLPGALVALVATSCGCSLKIARVPISVFWAPTTRYYTYIPNDPCECLGEGIGSGVAVDPSPAQETLNPTPNGINSRFPGVGDATGLGFLA